MGSLLSRVATTAQALPSRVFLFAREKWGKSSLFAHAPGAIYFMTRGETGLVELIAGGRVPPTAHFPYDEQQPPTWASLRQAVRELRDEDHHYKFLVIDTCNGAEILCQEHVRVTQFNNSQAKFASYGKGWDSCRVEWLGLLQDLDALRAKKKMAIVFLAHTQVKKFDDPTAEESYDKYRPACTEKLWELTHKWADIICFGHFEAQTYETDAGKTKAKSELKRVLCFDQSPLWEAGNRYGISGKLDVGGGAKKAFAAFAELVGKAKTKTAPANPKPQESEPPQSPEATPEAKPEGENRADPTANPATAAVPPAAVTEPPAATRPTRTEIDNARARLVAMKTAEAKLRVWESLSPQLQAALPEHKPQAPGQLASDVPLAGKDIVTRLIEQMHKLDLNWIQIRDGTTPLAREIASECGFAKMPGSMHINELTAAEAMRLHTELEVRVKAKNERAAKRAEKKAEAGVQS